MRTGVRGALVGNHLATLGGQALLVVLALASVTTLAVIDLRLLLVPVVIAVVWAGKVRVVQVRRREAIRKQVERERETQRRNYHDQKREAERRQQETERQKRAEQERESERRRRQAEQEKETDRRRQRERARTTRPGETMDDWWAVLGVPSDADKDEIVRSYRRKIQQCHPDRVTGLAPEIVELAESRTKALNAAYAQGLRACR
jgi:DnaJ-domain-containing protein 1